MAHSVIDEVLGLELIFLCGMAMYQLVLGINGRSSCLYFKRY
jgi:hypothetical protein